MTRTRLQQTPMTTTRRLLAALATAATVTVTATVTAGASAASAAPTEPPEPERSTSAIRGSARMDYPVATDHIQVTVNAGAEYGASSFPEKSWGTFRVYHSGVDPETGEVLVNWGDFAVDCLATGGPTATVTGTLVRVAPGSPWHLGDRSGVSFYVPRHGTARIGLAGKPETPLPRCMAPAADSEVLTGGYTLRDKAPAD